MRRTMRARRRNDGGKWMHLPPPWDLIKNSVCEKTQKIKYLNKNLIM